MSTRIKKGGLQIYPVLIDLVADKIAPGTGIEPDLFWEIFEKIINELAPINRQLLKKREAGEIGVSHGTDNYVSFLMIGLALFVSLILLLTTFGTPNIWF